MDHHLAGEEPGNRRNGYGKKTVLTDTGRIELAVPRDRQACVFRAKSATDSGMKSATDSDLISAIPI
jgi:transposase-like protein